MERQPPLAAPQGGAAGGPDRQPDRAPEGHLGIRVPPAEDGLLPARGPRPQAHLRRLPGPAPPVRDPLGPRLQPVVQLLDPRARSGAPAGRRRDRARPPLRVPEGHRGVAGRLRRAGLHLLPRDRARVADDALLRGHPHPRHYPDDDAGRHALRRRVDRAAPPLLDDDLQRGQHAALRAHRHHRRPLRPHPRGPLRARLALLPEPRRLPGRVDAERGGAAEPGGLRAPRLLDPRHAGDGVPEPPPALQALPHHHGDPERLRARPLAARPAAARGAERRGDRRDGHEGGRGARARPAGRPRADRGLHLEGDPRLLHVHRVRPLLGQLPGPQDGQDPQPQAVHPRPARPPLRPRGRVPEPRGRP